MSSFTLRLLAGVLAVGAALAGYLGYRASQPVEVATAPREAPTPAPKHQAVFAARDIPPGHLITTADVTLSPVPEVASRAFTTQDQVVGQTPWVAVASGELLLSHQFLSKSALARTVPPGERAVAVAIDEASGVGGFVQPGDEVDVLLYLHADKETGEESSAQVVLRGARVLAFGNQQESPPPEARKTLPEEEASAEESAAPSQLARRLARRAGEDQEKAEEPTGKKSKTAVLAVREEDASRLMLAESAGKLCLSLHGIAPESEPAALHQVALAGGHTSAYRLPGDRPPRDRHYLPLRSLAGTAPLPRPTAPTKASTGARGIFVHKGDVLEVVHPGASPPPPAPAPAALGLPLTPGTSAFPKEAAK